MTTPDRLTVTEDAAGAPRLAVSSAAVYGGLVGALLVGIAGVVLVSIAYGVGWGDGLRCSLYIIAAAVVAIILGLIFGVPRARADFVAGVSERYASNSNLEQISDWLTKLLVGAGLVQLTSLPAIVTSLGDYLGDGMAIPNAEALTVASVVYGIGVGFVFGYLWTRLRMRLLLEASDRMAAEVARAKDIAESLRRQNEKFAQTEPGRDLDRAAEVAVRARRAVGTGSIAPILWVDDMPQNNTALINSLRSLDIEVELTRSTADALDAFDRRSYGLVITDLGRQEEESYNPNAGIDLIRAVRVKDPTIPIFVFATHRAVAMQDELLSEGATLVTSRASVLFEEATKAVTMPNR